MDSSEFNKQYSRLNKEQKAAVDTIEGPVFVIAGPGTGKTQVLSLRIANILRKTDADPSSILALTFTDSAAYSMRLRLQKIIGSHAYRTNIFTFHGFCNEIIRNFPDYFPKILGSTVAGDVERIKIVEDIIKKTKLRHLKPFGAPTFYVKPVLSSIQKLKRENISPKKLSKLIKKEENNFNDKGEEEKISKVEKLRIEKRLEKNKELLILFEQYEKTLSNLSLYDYEDMILELIRALESNPDLLVSLQEEYQYILADEHQDANDAQNRILELLSGFHKSPNLFIVGDEKQAIFRFQGASLQNFLYFKSLYPEALLLTLKTNYRSTQTILDATHSLISKNNVSDPLLRARLIASRKGGDEEKKITFYEFSKPAFEYAFLGTDIKEKIKSGIKPESIAVFYRNNSDADPIIKALEREGVPFEVYSDQSLFLDENIKKLVLLLKAINSFGDETILSELLFVDFLKFDNLDIYKLLKHCQHGKNNMFDCLSSKKSIKEAGLKNVDAIFEFYKKLSHFRTISHNKTLVDFLEIVLRESGYIDFILSQSNIFDQLNKLTAFLDQAKALAENKRESKLKDFITYLEVLKEHNILVKSGSTYDPEKSAVRLMTAHKAKGLEFDHVYITGLYDGHWGNTRSPKHFHLPGIQFETSIEDERRLFYVALTRARIAVYLSFSKEGDNKKPRLPAQFVSEIDEKFLFKADTLAFEKKFSKKTTYTKKLPAERKLKEEKTYLRDLFFDRGFSVTALNNYLECPWKYFFENLLRLPRLPNKSQRYGIAVHRALEEFFTSYKTGEKPTSSKLLAIFERTLKRQSLSNAEFHEVLEKGRKSLTGYYDAYKGKWSSQILVEYKISGVELRKFKIGKKEYPLCLTGSLDKIEFLSDGKVNVVDYKTSKPATRNQILGNTKDSRGNIYRQLVFYKILLDRYQKGKFNMVSGEIDFTESDKSGRYKKEKFEILEDDVKNLVGLINSSVKQIASFSFWDKTCDVPDCHYCALRKAMDQN